MEAIKIKSFRQDHDTLAKRLLAINGYSADHSYNPHRVKAYIISNEFGPFAVAIGSHEQEALDNAVDWDCMDHHLLDEYTEESCSLGNASEPLDLTYIAMRAVAQYN